MDEIERIWTPGGCQHTILPNFPKNDMKPKAQTSGIVLADPRGRGGAAGYRPQRSCGQGYVFTRVCDSAHRGGGGFSRQGDHPPSRLGDHHHSPPGTRQTPPPQTHFRIRSTSGRYASYLNAFLFWIINLALWFTSEAAAVADLHIICETQQISCATNPDGTKRKETGETQTNLLPIKYC